MLNKLWVQVHTCVCQWIQFKFFTHSVCIALDRKVGSSHSPAELCLWLGPSDARDLCWTLSLMLTMDQRWCLAWGLMGSLLLPATAWVIMSAKVIHKWDLKEGSSKNLFKVTIDKPRS